MSRDFSVIESWVKGNGQQDSKVLSKTTGDNATQQERELLNSYQPAKEAVIHFEKTGENTARLVPGHGWEHNIIAVMRKMTFNFKKNSADENLMVAAGLPMAVSSGLSVKSWTVSVDPVAELFTDQIVWQIADNSSAPLVKQIKSVITTYSWPIYQPD